MFNLESYCAIFPTYPKPKNPEGCTGKGDSIEMLLLGESSIAGVGVADHKDSIAGHVALELADRESVTINWKVVAKSGYTAKKVSTKLIDKIPDQPFDLIMIGMGGNDTFQLTKPWVWRKHMGQLVKKLHVLQPSAKIVITCLPPVHTFTAFSTLLKFFLGWLTILHGHEIRRLAKGLPYLYYYDYVISLEEWMLKYEEAKEPSDFFSDGVHPSALTYEIWGRETARFIHKRVL